ncbi:MAG: hypothetical protein ABL962_10295, partial [Fimbriimonadaceae bacterium]
LEMNQGFKICGNDFVESALRETDPANKVLVLHQTPLTLVKGFENLWKERASKFRMIVVVSGNDPRQGILDLSPRPRFVTRAAFHSLGSSRRSQMLNRGWDFKRNFLSDIGLSRV